MKLFGMKRKIGHIVGITILGVLGAVCLGLILGYLVELLWNWLMPMIFGIKKIDYWQAFGLIILTKLLFGGMGHHHDEHGHNKHHFHGGGAGEHHLHLHHRLKNDADWKSYDTWWEEEGRASFENYLKLKNQKEDGLEQVGDESDISS
jgi:hypothetical protein